IWKTLLSQIYVTVLFINTCRIQSFNTIDSNQGTKDVGLFNIDIDQVHKSFFYIVNSFLNSGGSEAGGKQDIGVEILLLRHEFIPLTSPAAGLHFQPLRNTPSAPPVQYSSGRKL